MKLKFHLHLRFRFAKARYMINLFPKDEIFYNLFEKQAEKLTEATELLDEILKNPQTEFKGIIFKNEKIRS